MNVSLDNPFNMFANWLEQAKSHPQIAEPTAMSLATCVNNKPSLRIVLLKEYSEQGFVFYSNETSQKGQQLAQNPNVALCFYWMPLELQVRITGCAKIVDNATADAYFASRSRAKQIGAWASLQSSVMRERGEFEARIAQVEAQYAGAQVPRPPHWVGWRVAPETIEFWQQLEHRLHHRQRFVRGENVSGENVSGENGWTNELLYP